DLLPLQHSLSTRVPRFTFYYSTYVRIMSSILWHLVELLQSQQLAQWYVSLATCGGLILHHCWLYKGPKTDLTGSRRFAIIKPSPTEHSVERVADPLSFRAK